MISLCLSSIKGLKGALRANQPLLFLIDDFDCFLHPKLVNILLRIFNEWSDIGMQLIATIHNTDILDTSIRTDQVWFVDKSYYGVSTLYSVFDYNEFKNKLFQYKRTLENKLEREKIGRAHV